MTGKLIGAGLLFIGAVLLSRLLSRGYREREECYAECLLLLSRFSLEIRERGTKLEDILQTVTSPYLETCGFLSSARSGGLSSAFSEYGEKLPLQNEDRELLSQLFSSLGKDTRDVELEKLSRTSDRFSEHAARIGREAPVKGKTARVLVLTSALLAILLFI